MKRPILALVIFASIFLAGCPVTDLQPLYNENDNVTEPALVGKWSAPDANNPAIIEFQKPSGNRYNMIVSDPVDGYTDTYEVHLVRLGGNLFADLRFSGRTGRDKDKGVDMPIAVIPAHIVLKLEIVKDNLAWSTMEDDALEKISATDKASPAYVDYKPEGILVTADTNALRRYVTAHGTDGFSGPENWHRAQ